MPSSLHGSPAATLQAALDSLNGEEVRVLRRSRWYRSAPVPISDQPWYVNGVAEVATGLAPAALLARLADLEQAFGRVRGVRNAPRIIDLDLLAYDDFVSAPEDSLQVPHPRLSARAFVVLPLAELAPRWRHPVSGQTIQELCDRLPSDQIAEAMVEEA